MCGLSSAPMGCTNNNYCCCLSARQKMAITRVAVTAVLLVLYWSTHQAKAQGG